MSNTLELHYVWDKVTALLSSELFYKYEFRHSYRRYLGWGFIAMAQFGMVGALKHDSYGMLFVSSFLLLYWYVVRWQMRKRLAQRQFSSSLMADKNIVTRFDDNGMQTGESHVTWDEMYRVVEKEQGFLLYTAQQGSFIPKAAFNNSDERDSFRKMLVQHQVALERER